MVAANNDVINANNAARTASQLVDQIIKSDAFKGAQFSIGKVISSIFTLHSARFNTSIATASGGSVSLSVDFTFFGKRRQFEFSYDFTDQLKSVTAWFNRIFTGEFLADLGIGVKNINETCTAHIQCKDFGPATTAGSREKKGKK